LISCSYDGSIRGFDIHTQKSLELFVHPEEHAIGHFDFRENDLWFSTHYGSVGIVDPRSKHARFYEVSEKKLNTIHMNPINQSYFCTAGLDGFVRIFDVRKIDSLEPVMTWKHEKSVNSAYWSPNGNDIVSTSFDDTLGLWKDVLCKESHVTIRHNNNTGRWIQKFKAVWNPSSQTIMVGNMKRGIDLYDVHGRKAFQLTDDDRLTAIPAVNVFHLTIDMILSGNASGKMTIWK
jgi:WD40 repeat protein